MGHDFCLNNNTLVAVKGHQKEIVSVSRKKGLPLPVRSCQIQSAFCFFQFWALPVLLPVFHSCHLRNFCVVDPKTMAFDIVRLDLLAPPLFFVFFSLAVCIFCLKRQHALVGSVNPQDRGLDPDLPQHLPADVDLAGRVRRKWALHCAPQVLVSEKEKHARKGCWFSVGS